MTGSRNLSPQVAYCAATLPLSRESGEAEVEAKTIERRPSSTIDPSRTADAAGLTALTGLLRDRYGAEGILVDKTLATGGMGIVKLATQVAVGREVAVKSLRPDITDDASLLKLVREAWVTGSLEHPNIVPVYDVRIDADGLPLIVLKRIQGVHWGELLEDPERARRELGGSDLLEQHLRILIQVANAVHFAHSRHIIHRDLKPENVMIGSFGEIYVLDWGLAVSLVPDPSGRLPLASDADEMAGTPCYMAPEMIGNQGIALSEKTDVYLLGAILFEILEGHPPHDGSTLVTILSQVLASEPKFSGAHSHEIVAICKKALHRDPAQRFESALALREAIGEFLTHRDSVKLSERASSLLVDLRRQIAIRDAGDAEARATRVLGSFGGARFGFRAALEAWPENPEAARGLAEATSLVVDFELTNGNPHTASTLLGELENPPERLLRRVERKLQQKLEEDQRRLALERDRDPDIGKRTRLSVALILGTLWTIAPLFAWYVLYHQRPPSHAQTIAGSALLLVILLGLAYWARESFRKTALNRGLMGSAIFALSAHMLLEVGATILDVPEMNTQAFKLLLWFAVLTMDAIVLERRMAPISVALGIAFVAASLRPGWAFHITALVNFATMITFTVIWWPKPQDAVAPSSRALLSGRDDDVLPGDRKP